MLSVYLTIDVEVWCGGGDDLDRRFTSAFQRYVYGHTPKGNFGLEYQLQVLREHNLTAICFMEPLFATRFGQGPLEEVVGLIRKYGHETQLHLHPEWASESRSELLPRIPGKRRLMSEFGREEQQLLINVGKRLLEDAGGGRISAFRAGNFGLNLDTLRALAASGISIDSSYNGCLNRYESGLSPEVLLTEPFQAGEILEVPITVFSDGIGGLHHAQLGACTTREMEHLLDQAHELGRRAFVILSHNFELLNQSRSRVDSVMLKRFHRLCEFLARRSGQFSVVGFDEMRPQAAPAQPAPLTSSAGRTFVRKLEQLARQRFSWT